MDDAAGEKSAWALNSQQWLLYLPVEFSYIAYTTQCDTHVSLVCNGRYKKQCTYFNQNHHLFGGEMRTMDPFSHLMLHQGTTTKILFLCTNFIIEKIFFHTIEVLVDNTFKHTISVPLTRIGTVRRLKPIIQCLSYNISWAKLLR